MILGEGSHRYELVQGWGRLPAGMRYGYTHGVGVDSQDRVYIHNQSRQAVVVFDREGHFLNAWGEEFERGAHGMYLSREKDGEFLYFADIERHLVVKTTLEGEVLWELGAPNLPEVYRQEEQYKPTDVAVAPNGDFYVCDGYGESWVHHYNARLERIRSWGGKGSETGQLDCPHGVWVDTRPEQPVLLVADRGNKRIQIFSLSGQPQGLITEELRLPCCFYQYRDELYIPDLLARVTVFDRKNKLITHLGDNPEVWKKDGWPNIPEQELQPGKFVAPHAVCVDSHGDLYVVEWYERGRVTKLKRL